jgi:hypothetical protein
LILKAIFNEWFLITPIAPFYDWQFSGENEAYLDPARYQYREFFILVDALYEGKPVSYGPYIFGVDPGKRAEHLPFLDNADCQQRRSP